MAPLAYGRALVTRIFLGVSLGDAGFDIVGSCILSGFFSVFESRQGRYSIGLMAESLLRALKFLAKTL
jgi:hypothetical protein